MAEKKDRGRKALDVSSTLVTAAGTLVDMGATGGVLAGGKLLWDAVTAGIGWRRRRQVQAYLERLAEALGEERTAELAVELDQAGENEVWETVEEGFRAMMGTINETAKRCITLLVADYVVRRERPDYEFQLAGGILSSADEAILNALLAITRQYANAYNFPTDEVPASHDDFEYLLVHGNDAAGNAALWVTRNLSISGRSGQRFESDGELAPIKCQVAAHTLARYGFGVDPFLLHHSSSHRHGQNAAHPAGGAYLLQSSGEAAKRCLRLFTYLDPVLSCSTSSDS